MSNESAQRGSYKLLQQLAEKGQQASVEDLRQAVALPSEVDYKVLRWLIRGTPPFFELDSTFETDVKHVGSFVDHVVGRLGISDVYVLINGFPWPEFANIRVQAAGTTR
jgi:hypothetical protein